VRPSRLERLLRVFTEVREGEGATALLLFANVFLILCAYYLIKPLREGWISISEVAGLTKMEVKAYSSFGQSLLLIFVVMAYTRLSSRWSRRTLITRSTLFCMSNMVVFWLLQPGFFLEHLPGTGIAFYLWVGMFGVFVVAQFWAFVADLYTQERGDRLLPMVAIGATAGAVFGSWVSEELVHSQELMKKSLLIVALLPLAASILLTRSADRRGPLGQGHAESRAETPAAGSRRDALMLVLRSRYLLPVACATLLVNWVNTNGENLLFRVLQDSLSAQALASGIVGGTAVLEFTKDGTTAFYADFFFWVNTVALVLQALVASRLLKYGGFGAILMLLPMIALLSYATMALLPVLAVVKIMKIAENATDYSINNTARHVLWLPLPAEMVYKGKAAVETLFVRLGDGLAALTVLVGVEVLALTTQGFFAFTVALVLIWIWLSVVVVREHRRVSGEARADLGEGRRRGPEGAR
jgi:AAA family ATP:ADP antiporter